jgi:hypothetical protein
MTDNQQTKNITMEYELNTEAFLGIVDPLIEALMQKAENKDAAEFIPACLYFTGTLTYSSEFDTFQSFHEFHDQMFDLVQEAELQGNLKIRIMMMYYCHIIEMDSLYDFIYNLASIANGLPNEVEPFQMKPLSDNEILEKLNLICAIQNGDKKLKEFNTLTKKMIPVSIAQKIQMIQKALSATGLDKLGDLLETLHNQKIRNAFSHNSYNIFGGNIQLFTQNGFERLPLQDFLKLFMETVNFYASFAEKATEAKHKLADGVKREINGKYGKLSIEFIREGHESVGSFHIQSTKTTRSI